ncbi:hypothetical protein [Robertkochia solimangrovi]|uniref:hypothetical protein n=1 Tax=Robertkochia solimangrovi TaxID=2213046 RepID=UPI00117FA2F3|nr:hypothetical protein [Robertkochia solimangrovi]TRZ46497.1 hypothetical protein DMZ48_03960 [Robertkochia solimangrovi]
MKKSLVILAMILTGGAFAQSDAVLTKHYEAFYKQMKKQGDIRGAIDALTHLNVIAPDAARTDTLAYYYSNTNQHVQAINLLGTEKDTQASDLAVEVKAISLKSLNQPQLAVQQFDILFSRTPDVYLAYELVDLNLQIGKTVEAETYIKYGLENAKDDQMLPFYDSKPPYQVPIKAAFKYQEGLLHYNKDKTDIDTAVKYIDEAIAIAPNYLTAKHIRDLLLKQKEAAANPAATENKN